MIIKLVEEEDRKQEQKQVLLDNDIVILKSASIWDAFMREADGKVLPHKLQSIETAEFGPISQKNIASIIKDKFVGDNAKHPEDRSRGFKFSRAKLKRLERNYSKFEERITDEPIEVKKEKKVDAPDASDASDAFGDNATSSQTTKTVENGNNCNDSIKNIQENDRDIEDMPDQTGAKEPEPSQDVSKASNVSQVSEPSHRSSEVFNPIVSIEDFFSNDIPLPGHSIEESPCYHIISSRPGEIPTDTVYYCKLHPDMIPSTFVTQIELHCREKEPDIHKAEILRITERDTTQQHGKGESA